jgi:hypothetical protein
MKKLLVAVGFVVSAMAGYVKQVDRTINLQEKDVVIYVTDFKFVPSDDKKDKTFYYTVARDFENTLISVLARDSLRDEEIPITLSHDSGKNSSVLWYQV